MIAASLIEWSTDAMGAWADLIMALATVGLAVAAILAATAWRNELVGKDEYELGRKMLILYWRAYISVQEQARAGSHDEQLKSVREFDSITDQLGELQIEANVFLPGFHSVHETFLDCLGEWSFSQTALGKLAPDFHPRFKRAFHQGCDTILNSVKPARFHKQIAEWWKNMNAELDRRDGVKL